MLYVTQEQLEARYAGLAWWTDRSASGAIDADVVAEAIRLACGEIDSHAARQYAVPLKLAHPATARLVSMYAGSIAGYRLAQGARADNIPETLRNDYEDALAWLRDLAAGKLTLDGEDAGAAPPSGGIVLHGGEKYHWPRP
ncbi:MAG: DUF1320 domain-containing protein [Phycisphaerae bacterium]|nr:DUF1320 domain-containing protein [Phycisphaerae bacterium]MCZ2398597.1 DUF1320 domain-containing protein [Phycisphaerae bacterium]